MSNETSSDRLSEFGIDLINISCISVSIVDQYRVCIHARIIFFLVDNLSNEKKEVIWHSGYCFVRCESSSSSLVR